MDAGADDAPGPRSPTEEDVLEIARSLHEQGARYALIGGIAMQMLGAERATKDIDLLVDPAPENVERVLRALCVLSDEAARQVLPTDVAEYTVVRIVDEVLVDLLASACGVTLADVEHDVLVEDFGGVPVRVLDAPSLIRTKMTIRPKDAMDREFLERILRGEI